MAHSAVTSNQSPRCTILTFLTDPNVLRSHQVARALDVITWETFNPHRPRQSSTHVYRKCRSNRLRPRYVNRGTSDKLLNVFLESIKWDEQKLRDRCQQIVAREHAHDEAIGTIDESGTAKSGRCTAAVARQYNGNRGKVENCTVGVHLGYSAPGFQTILDSRLYLPEAWANDPQRRKKTTFRMKSRFKPSRKLHWT